MIKIYGGRGGSSLRAHWALAEAGQEYEEMALDMRAGAHKAPDFLKLNPNGQVPVLVDGDTVLTESMAVSHYVIDKYKPELLGATPEVRAESMRWAIWGYLNIQNHLGMMFYQMTYAPQRDDDAIAVAAEAVKPYLAILENHLAKSKYVAGDSFTVADINVGVSVSYGFAANYDMTAYPNVIKWFGEISARPAYIKARGN